MVREKKLHLIIYITELLKKYELQKFCAALTPLCKHQDFPVLVNILLQNTHMQKVMLINGNGMQAWNQEWSVFWGANFSSYG